MFEKRKRKVVDEIGESLRRDSEAYRKIPEEFEGRFEYSGFAPTCLRCGSWVPKDKFELHDAWHDAWYKALEMALR